jgi:uncharacterized protein YecT (DUF1311 family)
MLSCKDGLWVFIIRLLMKKIFITIVLALIFIMSFAKEKMERITKDSYEKTLTFKEFHDPGYILTTDGEKYFFYYKGFTYENISTWKKGRKLLYSYNKKDGTTLYDRKSGTKASIQVTQNKHPINLISDNCINNNESTAGIASCYDQEYKNWDNEMNRIYNKLKNSYNEKEFSVIREMQRSWLKYRDNRFKTNRMVHKNETGTISIIESNARAVSAIRDQTLYLLSIPMKE